MGMAAEPQFHVLAVDDSLIDRKLIERLLKSSSFQVTTVDSGSKALEFLGWQQSPPSVSPDIHQEVGVKVEVEVEVEVKVNLIITDYCMPEMTGYDLLKKVKESSSLRNIPVVIMSSENVPSRITRCLEEGAEEFFLKPVRLSDVNRLKPHMLRAKYGQQQQQDVLEDCQKPEAKPSLVQQQQQQQQQASEKQTEDQQLKQQEQEQEQQQQQQQVVQQQNNSKRKSLEDVSTPDRTRPRYSGITTVV